MRQKIISRYKSLSDTFWFSAVFAGMLLGVGFLLPSLWFLGIFGIAYCIQSIQKATTYIKLIVWLWVVFTIKILCSLAWCWSAYPVEWIQISSPLAQVTIIFFYWLSGSLGLGAAGVVLAILARVSLEIKIYPRFLWYVTLPFFWLLSEIAGAWFFSILTLGPGSFLQAYFSFGFVGYLLGTTSLGLFFASISSVYGLSVVMVYLAIGFLYINRRYKHSPPKVFIVTSMTLIIVSIFPSAFIGSREEEAKSARVISINTTFDSLFLTTEFGPQQKSAFVVEAVDAAVLLEPDFVILPEDSRYVQSIDPDNNPFKAMAHFQFTHQGTDSILVDSGRLDLASGETFLRATILDGWSGSVYQFDKQYLVPQGEYVPTLYRGLLTLLGYREMIQTIAESSSYKPGPLHSRAGTPAYLPGVLFCSESIRPGGVNSLSTEMMLPFVAHPVSHSWFHNSAILEQQLDVMLQIQSRYSGVPIISAGNMFLGKSYFPDGSIETGKVVGGGERWELVEFEL